MPTGSLGVLAPHDGTLVAAASASHDAMSRPLVHAVELSVSDLVDDGELLGAFQRRGDARTDLPLARRATGGGSVRSGDGIIQCVLALETPSALVAANEDQILNRYVRPFLAALTKVAAPAHYFGRDWISISHRPAAHVSFAHLRDTERTVVEVFVAARRTFASGVRSSHLGKEPIVLTEVAKSPVTADALRDALLAELAERHGLEAVSLPDRVPPPPSPVLDEPPWDASLDESIGPLCAGRDRAGMLRVGGELMASTDAIGALEERLRDASRQDLDAIVDAVFTAPKVALFGVRSLHSIRDVIAAALD